MTEEAAKKESGFVKDIRKAIAVAILMTVLFNPIITLLWSWVIAFSSFIYSGYLNSIYAGAALGHRNYVDVLILWTVVLALIGYSAFSIMRLYKPKPSAVISKLLSSRTARTLNLLMAVLGSLAVLLSFIGVYADLQLNTSFQQRLTVLAPVISDQEYKEYNASWASMKSRSDFLAITEKMNDAANSYGIELPDLLLK